jgi:hypothetical protein
MAVRSTNSARSSAWWWSSPAAGVNGEIAPVLDDLVGRGIVRLLDLLVLRKHTDGSAEAFGPLRDDMNAAAEAVEPGARPCAA